MPNIITCVDDFDFENLCLVPDCHEDDSVENAENAENAENFYITNSDNQFVYIRTPPMVFSGRYFTLRDSESSTPAFLKVMDALDDCLLTLKDPYAIVSMMTRRSSGDWRCPFILSENVTVFDVDGETMTNFEKDETYVLLVSPTQLHRCKQGFICRMDVVQGMRVDLKNEKQKDESATVQPQHVDTHKNLLSDES